MNAHAWCTSSESLHTFTKSLRLWPRMSGQDTVRHSLGIWGCKKDQLIAVGTALERGLQNSRHFFSRIFNFVSRLSSRTIEDIILTLLLLAVTCILVPVMHAGHEVDFLLDQLIGFQSFPSTWGTTKIVWICLTTIFSCVFVSYHHAVPETTP